MRVVSGIAVTRVATTAEYPLGEKFAVSQPAASTQPDEWIYVQAGAGGLVAGEVAMRASGTSTCIGVVEANNTGHSLGVVPAHQIVGVAQHAIAASSYGFVQCKGVGTVLCVDTGNDQLDEPLVVDSTAGRADVAIAAESTGVFAVGLAAAGTSAGVLFSCYINCLGA